MSDHFKEVEASLQRLEYELTQGGGMLSDERLIADAALVSSDPKSWKQVREKLQALLQDGFRPWQAQVRLAQQDLAKAGKVPPVLPVLSGPDVLVRYPALREVLIEDLLRRGETMNFIAQSKIGKSLLVMALAVCAANGVAWMGKKTRQSRVLYIDNELHPEVFAHRLRRIAAIVGLSTDSLHCLFLRGDLRSIDDLSVGIQRAVEEHEIDVIILDAFYRILPAETNENDNAAMTRVYNTIDHIAGIGNAAMILIHHASKGGQSDKAVTDVGSGAGAISRAADTHLILRHHDIENHIVVDAVTRSFPSPASFVLKRDGLLWETVDGVDASRVRGRKPVPWSTQALDDLVVKHLGPDMCPAKDLHHGVELAIVRAVPWKPFREALDRAVAHGRARRICGKRNALQFGSAEASVPLDSGSDEMRCQSFLTNHPDATTQDVVDALKIHERVVRRARGKMSNSTDYLTPDSHEEGHMST